jgi:putative membrane protein
MATDLVLAILHHVLVFGLVTLIVSEALLLRGDLNAQMIDRLTRLDRSYGMTAMLIIVIGVLRVIFGLKGYQYYLGNPWFWAKMASFAAIGLLSIRPTMRFLAWSRAVRDNPAFVPATGEVTSTIQYIRAESIFVVLVLVFAATMARFG